jgi:hypothetical protein
MPSPYAKATTGAGELTSGTYYLTSANYPVRPSCTEPQFPEERPSPIAETLVVDAKDATSGTFSWVSKRATFSPTRSSFAYSIGKNNNGSVLIAHRLCGDEVLGDTFLGIDPVLDYGATPDQLQLQTLAQCWNDGTTSSALYTYTKQP